MSQHSDKNTRKFKGGVKTTKDGSLCEFEFEMPEDATEDEIEEAAREAAFNYVEWWVVSL